jgi:hypothetical protein
MGHLTIKNLIDLSFGGLIILTGYAATIAYLPLQFYALVRLNGARRWAALLPIFLMAPVAIMTYSAYMQQSNLWPIMIIFASPLAALYLLGLLFWRSVRRGPPI